MGKRGGANKSRLQKIARVLFDGETFRSAMDLTEQHDLRSGATSWADGFSAGIVADPLPESRVDVAICGAGIMGAMLAERPSADGLRVALVDRRRPAHGSTAASTALVLWEADLPRSRSRRHHHLAGRHHAAGTSYRFDHTGDGLRAGRGAPRHSRLRLRASVDVPATRLRASIELCDRE
jgi:hypothetical protein